MAKYEDVLNAIDEGLVDKFHNHSDCQVGSHEGRKKAFFDCLKKFMDTYPDKKECVKTVLANSDGYCLSNTKAGHIELYLLPLFHDTETLLQILENPYSYQEANILSYDIEQKVLDVILERNPAMLATYLRKHLERKEEYREQVLEFFVKVQKGEMTYSRYDKRFDFFDVYKDDTKLWIDLLENPECSLDFCNQILKFSKDEQVIGKAIERVITHSKDKNVLSIYDDIIREILNEEVYKYILGQTDNEKIVNYIAVYRNGLSDDFKKQLLHHPKLSSAGWYNLSERLPKSAFNDAVIEQMLKKIPSEIYRTDTETIVNRVLQHILELRPNAEYAKKVFDCCTKLPDYGSNGFCYSGEEGKVFRCILGLDTSDEMANRVLDYAVANGHTKLFGAVLEKHPTTDMLQKIDKYYQAYYKEKAKVKEQMRLSHLLQNKRLSENKTPAEHIKELMLLEDKDIEFANEDAKWAYFYLIHKNIVTLWKENRTPEVEAVMQAYFGDEKKTFNAPEVYEKSCDKIFSFIKDEGLKKKLQNSVWVNIPVLVEKEQIDYAGYHEAMSAMWGTVIEHSDDLQLLDKVVMTQAKIAAKAQAGVRRIKQSHNKETALCRIKSKQDDMKEICLKKRYIRQKLTAMYPKLSFEKALTKAFKQMVTTEDKKEKEKLGVILNAEGLDFYINYLENAQEKISPEILDYVLKEKEKMFDKLPQYDEYDRQRTYGKIGQIEKMLQDKGIIKTILSEKYPDLSYEEAIIREAARVVKSGDEKEKERFNNLLLAEGEQELLNGIDERVCAYLVDNFTKQNLDDVNALRSFYGLKIIIDETPFEEPNYRTVRRMQFDDSVSTTDQDSEYYVVQYSEAYRNFKADRRHKFKESDYYDMMDRSEAFQILFDYGYADFAYVLPQALAKAKVPPEVAEQFNIKDLQAVFYYTLPDEEKDVFGWNGDFLFTKKWIEIEGEYDEANLMGARMSYWMDMVKNKQLVRTMKNDFLRHDISQSDTDQLFEMAAEEGRPNAGRRWERVTDVKLQLHHILGLKDGGLNYPSNYAPVAVYEDGTNSHEPLHRYDTPKDIFYVVEGAKAPTDVMLTMKPQGDTAKKVRIRTVFVDDEINPHKKVLFYGGARKCSRYVGRLHGMENIALEAEQLGKEYRARDAKSQLLMQIVFQNYVDMHNRLVKIETDKKNKAKRKQIEKNKANHKKTSKSPMKEFSSGQPKE